MDAGQLFSSFLNRWSVTELLVILLLTLFTVSYINFLWNRRRLYWMSSKIPGPFALPLIGSVCYYYTGNVYDIFNSMMALFDKYSGTFKVWLGPRLYYCISEPKHLEIILTNCLQKDKMYNMAGIIVGHGIFTAPYHLWKRNRKIISPTFNQKILDSFVAIFSEQGDILVDQLKKYDGKGEFDVFHLVSNCSLDIICETAMGVKVNAQTSDAMYTLWTDRILEIVFFRMFRPWYHSDRVFKLFPLGWEAKAILSKMHEFSGKVVKEKKIVYERIKQQQKEKLDHDSHGQKRKAFLDHLIELTQDENNKFTEEQLRMEVDTFIIGGSDTSSTVTCFLLTMLGIHQDFQEKAYNEIIQVIGADRPIQPDDLSKLKYLERLIKETMRLFPTGGIIVRCAENDVDVGEYVIPAGASVVVGILKVHTNEEYWPDPYKFDPDRFLPEVAAKRPTCAYIPFSHGARNCIGLRYAMMVMKTSAVAILRKYKIYTRYKNVQEIKLQQNLIIKPRDGYQVYINCR